MKPRTSELTKIDRRMMSELMARAGWPTTPRQARLSGWWWISDRLGDQLEDPR